MEAWKKNSGDTFELTKTLFDLFFVAVLLDAGAGSVWKFIDSSSIGGDETVYSRSEGLAMATLRMFLTGKFSSDPTKDPFRVDGKFVLLIYA